MEKKPGRFYFRSKPFLHFHGGDTDRVADVKLGPEWTRRPAETATELEALRVEVEAYLEVGRTRRSKPSQA